MPGDNRKTEAGCEGAAVAVAALKSQVVTLQTAQYRANAANGDSGTRTSSIRHDGRTKYHVDEMEKWMKSFKLYLAAK